MARRKRRRLPNIQRKVSVPVVRPPILECHIDDFGDGGWNCQCGDRLEYGITHPNSDGSEFDWYTCLSCGTELKVFVPPGYIRE